MDSFIARQLTTDPKHIERISEAERILKPEPLQVEIGMELDVLDTEHIWCVAKVVDIRPKRIPHILVHYEGWSRIYDEFIPLNSPRLSRLGTYTKREGTKSIK